MALKLGIQKAAILENHVYVNEKNTIVVNLKVQSVEDDMYWTKIYITDKSAGIARAKLKACGFDCDKLTLDDLESQPMLLAGNEVEIDVFNETYNGKENLKVEIVTGPAKPAPGALAPGTALLRAAKKKGEKPMPEDDIPF